MGSLSLILDLAVVTLLAGVVGILCKKLRLSVVVGYLLTGILIGPYTPPFQLVGDANNVQMLADLGLIFLIFGIGLSFSIRRIQRLGASPLIATALGALIILAVCRFIPSVFGMLGKQTLFIAAILMVSSSAIIAKVLEETGANHTRWGQLALAVTLLEDIIAITMLTLLSSFSTTAGESDNSVLQTLFSFTGFVALFSVGALILIPALLRTLKLSVPTELLVLTVTGLLLLLGWVASSLGYSMALTAFILGAVIGSTPQRPEIERLFEGIRHLFGAVFFVAMGMLFDIGLVVKYWPALLGLTLAVFVLRIPATTTALLSVGNNFRDSFRAGITLTPLGEFSFVIAFLGVQTGVMPEYVYPVAVGASLLTCIISPFFIKRADPISASAERMLPESFTRVLKDYRDWLDKIYSASQRSIVWNLMAPRIGQTLFQLFFVGGCLALTGPAYDIAAGWFGPDLLFTRGTVVLFILTTGIILLPPLVAVWRNISALSLIAAEATTGHQESTFQRVIIQKLIATIATIISILWLTVLIPANSLSIPLVIVIIGLFILAAMLLWRSFVLWHSRIESHIKREFSVAQEEEQGNWTLSSLSDEKEWSLQLQEVTIPSDALHAGKRILDLRLRDRMGCSIVSIDRQGFAINNPTARDCIYPEDRILILGSPEALASATQFLTERTARPDWLEHFDELATETVTVPAESSWSGKNLIELNILGRFEVQIAGIKRDSTEIISPSGSEVIYSGDVLLVLGTQASTRKFIEELKSTQAPQADADPALE